MAKNPDDIGGAVTNLINSAQTLQLATLNEAGLPLVSYAPFVHLQGQGLLIFVSELAAHTRNMQRHPATSAMAIRDESLTRQMFARERIRFDCRAQFITVQHPDWNQHLTRFEAKFGAVMKVLKGLNDFHLICLQPLSGIYIRGFGEAWSFAGPGLDTFEHIDSERLGRDPSRTARED